VSSQDDTGSPPAELGAYRAEKQRETYIRSSMEKTEALRNLLSEVIAAYNQSSGANRRIIAFGVSDAIRSVTDADMDYLRGILHRTANEPPPGED
jgi:ABC-type tungstate transport system permease subunit